MKILFAAKDLSFSQRRDLVAGKLREKIGSGCYLSEIYDDYVVFTLYNEATGYRDTMQRCTYKIDKDYAVEFGDAEEVVATTRYEAVQMSSAIFSVDEDATAEEDGFLLKPGKLFEAGEYPDKNFSLTEEEMDAAVAAYSGGAQMNIEHRKSILDGQLGDIRRVWRKGKELYAEFAVPKWLDAAAKAQGAALKVSAEFDRATKQLTGAAWTINPRVTDAALMAAFSNANTPSRGTATLRVADVTADALSASDPAAPASSSAAKENSPLKTLKDILSGAAAYFTKAAEEIEAPEQQHPATVTPAATPGAAVDPATFAAVQAENLRLKEERIQGEAETFAESMKERILPAEKDALIAAFKRAALDDAANPDKVTFSGADGKSAEGTRIDALKALYTSRPAHGLTAELVPAEAGDAVLFSDGGNPQRQAELANRLDQGSIFARRAAAVNGAKE